MNYRKLGKAILLVLAGVVVAGFVGGGLVAMLAYPKLLTGIIGGVAFVGLVSVVYDTMLD